MTRDLREIRYWISFFITALVLSGLTAFPLATELRLLGEWFHVDAPGISEGGLQWWFRTIRDGLNDTYEKYPWLGYGTDWLAFAHIVIAFFSSVHFAIRCAMSGSFNPVSSPARV